jgi:hypothetical protein
LVEDIIKYAERRNIPDKGTFVKRYFKPDLDIYSLDELVKKDEQERVDREIEKKKMDLDIFHQIDLFLLQVGKIKLEVICMSFQVLHSVTYIARNI